MRAAFVFLMAAAAAVQSGGTGLRGEYFESPDLENYKAVRLDPQINFDWGDAAPIKGVRNDNFSVRWTGFVVARAGETFTFYTDTDDGCRLWVNEQQLVDSWAGGGQKSGQIELKAGERTPIKMEHRDTGGGARARLYWSSPTVKKEIVPKSQLFPATKGEADKPREPAKPAEAAGGAPPFIDGIKVDNAIKKGLEWLKGAGSPGGGQNANSDGLILLTMLHGGLPEDDPKLQEILARMLGANLEKTYSVALQAMCLEELDRVKYQDRIYQCAQFLVDNQLSTGQWPYGDPTTLQPPPKEQPVATSTSGGVREYGGKSSEPGRREKPAIVKKIPVKKQRDGQGEGDNSNSQYAALGLRACHDAGIILPKEVILLGARWWRVSQHTNDDKGNPYGGNGWSYRQKNSRPSYASMTAGAVSALVIFDSMLGTDWKRDPNVLSGMNWLTAHFSVKENVGPPEHDNGNTRFHYYYYLYGLERAGMLFNTVKLGRHHWYEEGAEAILAAQKPEGLWETSSHSNKEWDTCFAILFLKRATRPVASQSAKKD